MADKRELLAVFEAPTSEELTDEELDSLYAAEYVLLKERFSSRVAEDAPATKPEKS